MEMKTTKHKPYRSTKQQYVDERAELLTALDKIETDRVMNRISVKQTKSIKINILGLNTEWLDYYPPLLTHSPHTPLVM